MHDLCSILLQQWLENANNPILAEEVAFIQQEDDLIQFVSTYKTPVREFIHRFNFLELAGIGNRKVRRQRNPPQPVRRSFILISRLVDAFPRTKASEIHRLFITQAGQ